MLPRLPCGGHSEDQALLLLPPSCCPCRCVWLPWGHLQGLSTEPTFKAQAWDTVRLVSVDAKSLVPVASTELRSQQAGVARIQCGQQEAPGDQTAGQDGQSGTRRTICSMPQGLTQICVHLLLS